MLQTPDRSTKVLLELADYMERVDPNLYRQSVYDNGCGQGCIAFHATRMLGIKIAFAEVAERIGITREQADKLFHPDAGVRSVMGLMHTGPSPREAARAIRHLAVTGDVPDSWIWSRWTEPVDMVLVE
jgi:hypothetical protein